MNANRRSIVVKDVMWNKLKKLARKEGRSLSELIREAISDLLAKRETPRSNSYDPRTDRLD